MEPIRRATGYFDMIGQTAQAAIRIAKLTPEWYEQYADVASQTGNGGVEFAKVVVEILVTAAAKTTSDMRSAVMECLNAY